MTSAAKFPNGPPPFLGPSWGAEGSQRSGDSLHSHWVMDSLMHRPKERSLWEELQCPYAKSWQPIASRSHRFVHRFVGCEGPAVWGGGGGGGGGGCLPEEGRLTTLTGSWAASWTEPKKGIWGDASRAQIRSRSRPFSDWMRALSAARASFCARSTTLSASIIAVLWVSASSCLRKVAMSSLSCIRRLPCCAPRSISPRFMSLEASTRGLD